MARGPIVTQRALSLATAPRQARITRRPMHRFHVRAQPWVIQPVALAPVLPGDTLDLLFYQARVISDAVRAPLIGWWSEWYWAYVPIRAMPNLSTSGQAMMLDINLSATNTAAASYPLYRAANQVNWIGDALDAVVAQFFREDGEALNVATIDSMNCARLGISSVWDSLDTQANYDANQAPDVVVEGSDADTDIEASEVISALETYNFLREHNLVDATFEDYLRAQGVKVRDQELEITPELIDYHRKWTYPTNTVDATGAVNTQLVWSIEQRHASRKFFREPGFLIGCVIARPKVYLTKQSGNAAGAMNNAFPWLPAILSERADIAMKRYASGAGPFAAGANYIFDLKDLLLYGDQYLNFDFSAVTDAGVITASATGLYKKYPVDADVTALFKSGGTKLVRYDGVANFHIRSKVMDSSAET